MRRSILFVTAVASLFGLAATEGCMLKPQDDGADKYRQAIPQTNDVALSVPKSSGGTSSTTSYSTKGVYSTKGDAPTTSDAKYYAFTRDIADATDATTAIVLGLVWVIVHSPPTSVDAHHAVWGPGSGNALDPNVWRMTATEVAEHEYDYVLAARPKASTSEGDYVSILTGHGWDESSPNHRSGWFLVDNDAYKSVDPMRGHDSGTVRIDFDARSYPITIDVDAETGDPAKGWFKIQLEHDKDAGGSVAVQALGDIETVKDGNLENVTLNSKWNSTGAGRSDATISGGDLKSEVDATECWDTNFQRVYYTDTIGYEPTMGAASACAFSSTK